MPLHYTGLVSLCDKLEYEQNLERFCRKSPASFVSPEYFLHNLLKF